MDGVILNFLLKDRTTNKNIVWATDSYCQLGDQFSAKMPILPELVYAIKRRTEKTKDEQKDRTRKRAEVFTPSWLCCEMTNNLDEDWFGRKDVFNSMQDKGWFPKPSRIAFPGRGKDWKRYVQLMWLEITCGEAPYLVSRYDTTTGEELPLERRIGVLDRKLRVVNENTFTHSEWLEWAFKAYKSTYGFEFQGDNLFLARENILNTFIDYYVARFNKEPELKYILEITDVITWNIWQMDGLKDCVPFSKSDVQLDLFSKASGEGEPILCKIKDWKNDEVITFQSIKVIGDRTC